MIILFYIQRFFAEEASTTEAETDRSPSPKRVCYLDMNVILGINAFVKLCIPHSIQLEQKKHNTELWASPSVSGRLISCYFISSGGAMGIPLVTRSKM